MRRPTRREAAALLLGLGVGAPVTGFPAILRIEAQARAEGHVPIDRLFESGRGKPSFTAAMQSAIADLLPELGLPVQLNPYLDYRLAQRLDFCRGSGLIGAPGTRILAASSDFDNRSPSMDARYGPNAVLLSAAPGASGVVYRDLVIAMSGSKDSAVMGIAAIGCPNLTIEECDLSGFNNGSLIRLNSCKDARIARVYLHDCVLNLATKVKTAGQLTGISIDGDELLDGSNRRIGSTFVIERPRIMRLVCTDEVYANIGGQTDGINIAGSNAVGTIIEPVVDSTFEALDTFGKVCVVGGTFTNSGYYGLKLAHDACGCRVRGLTVAGSAIAGITAGSSDTDERGISDNLIEATVRDTGICRMTGTSAGGTTVSDRSAFNFAPGDVYDVLLVDFGTTRRTAKNTLELVIENSRIATHPVRMTTAGSDNQVAYRNPDRSIAGKTHLLSGGNRIVERDKT